MSEVNMGLDFVSLYLHDDRKKTDKDRNFVNTQSSETQDKEPTFLDKLYANLGTKSEDLKNAEETERKNKELNLLENKAKWVPVTVNSNSKFELSNASVEQLQKNKQVLDEIIEKLKV